MDYPDNQVREYHISRIDRCALAKRAFVISVHAHNLFATIAHLTTILGPTQQPKLWAVSAKTKDTRPWFVVLTKDSVWTGETHDGHIGIRLYINDDQLIEYLDGLCEPALYHRAIITLP